MKSKLEPHINEIQSWLNLGTSYRDMARRLCLNGTLADHESVRRFIHAKGMVAGGATPSADATPVAPGGATPPDATPDATPPAVAPAPDATLVPVAKRVCAAPAGVDAAVLAAAEARAAAVVRRVNIPAGYNIYPSPVQFFSWAEAESRDWYQVVTPGGGETTLSETELLEKFGAR